MRRRQLLTLSLTGAAVSLTGCFGNPDAGKSPGSTAVPPDATEVIEVKSSNLERDEEGTFAETVRIRGQATNVGEEDVPNVQFLGRYFDEDDEVIQEKITDFGLIRQGRTVSFEIGYQGTGSAAQKVDRHEVVVGQNMETSTGGS